jgi:hypothetical protein
MGFGIFVHIKGIFHQEFEIFVVQTKEIFNLEIGIFCL